MISVSLEKIGSLIMPQSELREDGIQPGFGNSYVFPVLENLTPTQTSRGNGFSFSYSHLPEKGGWSGQVWAHGHEQLDGI